MRGVMAVQPSLNPARFSARGYSEYRPIASNDTEEGRAQNRRVEVFIARSMRFSGASTDGSDNEPKTGTTAPAAAPTTAAPAAGSAGASGDAYKLSTDMRPAPQSPGVVPEPLRH